MVFYAQSTNAVISRRRWGEGVDYCVMAGNEKAGAGGTVSDVLSRVF